MRALTMLAVSGMAEVSKEQPNAYQLHLARHDVHTATEHVSPHDSYADHL